MTEYVRRHMTSALAVTPWLWWTGLFAILVLGPATVLLSEDGPYFSMVEDSPLFSDQLTGRSGQALGAVARGGYFTGPAVGRVKGIAPLELMPYMFFDQGMVLGDIRGFRADNGYWGTNLGLGYRHYVSPWDRIFGVNFFYDYDNTSTKIFRQIGFGLETYGKWWDMRSNAYFPIGTQSQLLNTQVSPGSQRFSGHQLLFDLINTYGTALKGADAEVGIPLSIFGEVADVHDLRMYAGGYHYESDTTGGFNGWSGRIQGDLIPSLLLQLIVTNDSHFDTNVVFGATWSFGGFKQPPEERKNQFSRMTTPIWRQYTISIDRTDVLLADQVAINPSTGNPYFIDHVDSNAAGVQDGTFENPFQSLNNPGIAADRASNVLDIVYVHGDSVYNTSPNNSVTLLDGYSANRFLRYLGEGDSITHTVRVNGLGNVQLPAAPSGSVRPTFNNATGNGVTLANFTEFSGFIINNPSGNGIFGSGVHDVALNQNIISNAGGDGALFLNAGGNIDIGNLQITNPTGIGFHVTGGTPVIRFNTNQPSQITNSGAAAVVVSDTLAGSSVNMSGATVSNTGSSDVGVLISNVAGGFALGNVTIQNSSSYGIQIIDTTGAANFNGSVNIINPGDNGIQISNLGATGSASFNGTTQIGSRNAIGINLLSIAGAVAFSGDTTIGTPATGATAAPGVNWQGSLSGSTTSFGSITITDSAGDGFALGTTTANAGRFQVGGAATVGGTTGGIGVNIANNTSDSLVRFNSTLGVSGRTNQGVAVLNNNGTVTFNGIATIDNPNLSVFPAVDLQGNSGDISFSTLTINDATGTGSLVDPNTYGVGLNIMDNPALVTISTALNVTATDGIALFAESAGASTAISGGLRIADGILSSTSSGTAAGTPTIDISNSSYTTINFTSVSNTNSSREGIRLVNNAFNSQTGDASGIPVFSITGQNNSAGSGGEINSAAAQGLLGRNTGSILLSNMNFLNNLVGIQTETTDNTLPTLELSVSNLQVSNSTNQGVYALSTQVVNILGSTFSGNGSGGDILDNDVRLVANFVDPNGLSTGTQTYAWSIQNTDFSDNSSADIADTIFASNVKNAIYSDITGGGLNATMVTTVLSNASNTILIQGGAAKDAIDIIWGGNTAIGSGTTYQPSTIQGYTINMSGDDKTGINFETVVANATTDFGGLYILSNNIIGNGDGNIGINVITADRSQILIDNAVGSTTGNSITLNQGVTTTGTTGIGMRFALGTNSQVFVRHATINLAPTSADGIVFTNVQAPGSLVELSDNVINYASTSSGVAINFQSIISGTLAIQRSNTPENFVNWQGFAPTLFLPDPAPSGWFSNTINVNGIEFGQ